VIDRDGGETTPKDCFANGDWANGDRRLEDVRLTEKQVVERMDRLARVVAIAVSWAVSWAVSTGLWDTRTHALGAE